MIEDAELLHRYTEERSQEAFAELVRRRVNLVYSVALRQVGGDAHLAEDVTQRVFVDLARKAKALAGHAMLSGWLYRSAQFAATDVVRAERRRRAREQEAQTMHETVANPASPVDWENFRLVLDQALSELGAGDRDAVALRFFEERSFAEVGSALQLSEDAARKRVTRALDKLHSLLARRGVSSTTTAALGVALAQQAGIAAPAGLAASVTSAALTAAMATGGAGATGVLIFMSTTKTAVGIAVVVVAAIGFGIYEAKQRRRAEENTAAAHEERDALRMQLSATQKMGARSEQRAVRAEEQLTALEGKTRGLFGAKVAPVQGLSLSGAPRPNWEDQFSFIPSPAGETPAQGRQRVRTLNRASVNTTYQPFYQKLGLTAEQRERFNELVLDHNERSSDLFKKAAGQSPAKDRDSLQTVAEVVKDQTRAELAPRVSEVFGAEIGEAFRGFQETMAVRPVTNLLASELFYSEAPLAAAQGEQLVDIMVKNARTREGKVDFATINKEATLAAARTVLSARQMEAFGRQIDLAISRSAPRR